MIGIFHTINIRGHEFLRPNEFTLGREDVYAGEYTTCTGDLIADRVGWKYSDVTLEWDCMDEERLLLLSSIEEPVEIVFSDQGGMKTLRKELAIRTGFVSTPTRFTFPDGTAVWRNVQCGFRFIKVHRGDE